MGENEHIAAIHRAIAKRDRIVEREGDADGMRWEPWYLEELIAEELRVVEAMRAFDGRYLALISKAI